MLDLLFRANEELHRATIGQRQIVAILRVPENEETQECVVLPPNRVGPLKGTDRSDVYYQACGGGRRVLRKKLPQ